MARVELPEGAPEDRYEETSGKHLTLQEHLAELRYRLIISVLAVAVGFGICAVFGQDIIRFLEEPAKHQKPGLQIQYIDPAELFSVYLKVCFIGGLTIGMPVIVFEGLAFVSAGLTPKERRWVYPIVFSASALFLSGVAFAYFVALPPTMGFFLNFGGGLATPNIRISSYIDFATRLIFWTGVAFETPLIMMALGRLGVINARQLLRLWRFAVLGAFIASIFIAPHVNPVTHTIVAAPILALYFLGTLLVFLFQPRRPN